MLNQKHKIIALRFQRLFIILLSVTLLLSSLLLILFNSEKNIVFFYTPTEFYENKLKINTSVRIGGFVKENSFKKISLNSYEFAITDNNNEIKITYSGILPDLFRENQGTVIEGVIENIFTIHAFTVFAKHDENYMPASIQKQLQNNQYWKKNYK
jgi:cytochrome c-type biogenesis protein CcmE